MGKVGDVFPLGVVESFGGVLGGFWAKARCEEAVEISRWGAETRRDEVGGDGQVKAEMGGQGWGGMRVAWGTDRPTRTQG